MRKSEHPNDICECGDYRKDHAGGRGGCAFTPNPDHDRNDSDGHFGAGPCYQFRLSQRFTDDLDIRDLVAPVPEPTPEQIAVGARAIDEYYDGTKDAPFEGSLAYAYRAMKALEARRPSGPAGRRMTRRAYAEDVRP